MVPSQTVLVVDDIDLTSPHPRFSASAASHHATEHERAAMALDLG